MNLPLTEMRQERKRRRLLSALLLVLTAAAVLYVLFETEPIYNREAEPLPFEGSGTQKDPYQISGVEDAVALSRLVNLGKNFQGVWFRQTADLDFSSVENWTPIGDISNGFRTYFYGIYDGAGHTISNIRCDNVYAGYFGLLCGEVRNLGIESGSFTGATIGSIASHGGHGAVIFNCYNKADVFGEHRAGGIADNFDGYVLFCWNTGEVSATYGPAGLVSYNCRLLKESYCTGGEPVNAYFAGELDNSSQVTEEELKTPSVWTQQYTQRREYDPALPQDDSAVYMICGDDGLAFAEAGFLPEMFREEHDRAAVFSVLPDILLAAVAAVLLCMLPFMAKKIRAANEAARAAEELAAQKAAERAAAAPQEAAEAPAVHGKGWGRRAASACAFVLLLAWMLSAVNSVLLPKRDDGITNVLQYPEVAPGKVDLLILGGSMSGINLDFETFWSEYGISVFGLGSGVQTLWTSYYQLQEALDIHKPEVVVLDVKGVTQHYEYSDEGVKTTSLLGLSPSLNRIEAVRATVEQGEQMDYILGFPKYHDRFSALTKKDFSYQNGAFDWGSWYIYQSVGYVQQPDVSAVTEVGTIPEKAAFYLNAIIETCQENDIELVLIKTPDTEIAIHQPLYNAVQSIADAYGIPFLNYNLLYDEVGFLPEDFADDYYHLSVRGARKHALHLGAYLKENYYLKDHRGDPAYSEWDTFAAQRLNAFLSMTPDRDIWLRELGRGEYDIFIVQRGDLSQDAAYQSMVDILRSEGIASDCCFVEENRFFWNGLDYRVVAGPGDTSVYRNEQGKDRLVGRIDADGILCIVCANVTGEIADVSALRQVDGYAPMHQW